MNDRLLPYYNEELEYLRQSGAKFADRYPKIAGRLRWGDDLSRDPHVERLIEGFALLSARTRLKIDDQFPEISAALLGVLYPHLVCSIPSVMIAELSLDRRQADLTAGYQIDAGEEITATVDSDSACRYRTTLPVTAYPVDVKQASYRGQPAACPPVPEAERADSILRIDLVSKRPSQPIGQVQFKSLRFFIRGLSKAAFDLFELVHNETLAVHIARGPEDTEAIRLPATAIKKVGFDSEQRVLHRHPRSFDGYLLLMQYFAMPETFMFFEIDFSGLSEIELAKLAAYEDSLQLYFTFKGHHSGAEAFVSDETLRLGCTPAINLFPQRAEPIRVDGYSAKYRIVCDARRDAQFEVCDLQRVIATDASRNEFPIYPLYSLHCQVAGGGSCFYHLHREFDEQGAATYLSLTDPDNRFRVGDYVLEVMLLASNGRLADRLPYGNNLPRLTLVGGGPLETPQCVSQPRRSLPAPPHDELLWRLISHLSLAHVSLFDGKEGAETFREILQLYDYLQSDDSRQRAEAVSSIVPSEAVARCGPAGPTSLCRGLELNVSIDEDKLGGGGRYLLGSVIEHFFGMYSHLNTFTRTTLKSSRDGSTIVRWPPRTGSGPIL
ncbi:MAG: type VI secretion system baseplate subunit TssF [Planctomycetota bacterium]